MDFNTFLIYFLQIDFAARVLLFVIKVIRRVVKAVAAMRRASKEWPFEDYGEKMRKREEEQQNLKHNYYRV